MLEDDFTWVLRKALARCGLAPSEAAARAGLPEAAVKCFLRGDFDAGVARALAPVLGLDAEAFAGHAEYAPAPMEIPGITRLDLSFGNERVNAWLLETGGKTLLFDLGNEPNEVFEAIGKTTPDVMFLTHGHGDHTGGLERALASGKPVHSADQAGTLGLLPGEEVHGVRACRLDGHYTPALGYFVAGFPVLVFVAGDALFAGSMGGCADPARYGTALADLHAALDGLPDETVILPGHGPATTLGEERTGNPFFAAPQWKS